MKRRAFLTMLGGAAAWPMAARAQRSDRVRRIGVLMNLSRDEAAAQGSITAFSDQLQKLGHVDGRNVQIEIRWGAGDSALYRKYAAELASLQPDVILASTTAAVLALRQIAPTIPVVFVGVVDPVGSGLIANLARPGGMATGFTLFDYAIASRWLQVLKEIAPYTKRVAVLRDANIAAGIGQFAAIQTASPADLEVNVVALESAPAIEQAIAAFAREPNGGLIVTASGFGANNPGLIAALAARHRLPSIYPFRYFVAAGGLLSYGPDIVAPFRMAAGYIDRILKGEKPAVLPAQNPTKYELVINLKIARALGLDVPPMLLGRADEVIE